jgi:hypothetical protein
MTYKIQILFPVNVLYDLTEETAFIALSLRQYLTSCAETHHGYSTTKIQEQSLRSYTICESAERVKYFFLFGNSLESTVQSRVRRIIRFEENISEYEANILFTF